MHSSVKTYCDQANYREIAGLWLGLGTVVGVLELVLAAMAFFWAFAMFRNDDMPLAEFVVTTAFFSSFVLAPVVGWVLFARGWYWASMVVGGFPVVMAVVVFSNFARY